MDEQAIERLLTRRQTIGLAGAAGASLVIGRGLLGRGA